MTQLEKNIIIAEFMGFKSVNGCIKTESGKYYDYRAMPNFSCIKEQEIQIESENGYGLVEQDYLFVEDLKFNSSWDWLMPVICKIANEKHLSINATLNWLNVMYGDGFTTITEIYNAVIRSLKK